MAVPPPIDHGCDIRSQFANCISSNLARLGAAAVAAHVQRRHLVSMLRKMRDLMPPRVPQFRKTVDAEDQRAAAFDGYIEIDRPIPHGDKIHDTLLDCRL
jgi:hypothetical protein